MLERLEVKEWLQLNAKLQQKKNTLRKALNERGVMKKDKENAFDKYSYFSEAGYKKLFTDLFSEAGLELKYEEIEYREYEGTEKQKNGRATKLMFTLIDCETGFYENSTVTGEGLDKGDKAGYKAYTGALKYYLANTFMVATGDDAEAESPEGKANYKRTSNVSTRQQPKQQTRPSEQPVTKQAPESPGLSQETLAEVESWGAKVHSWLIRKYGIQTLEDLTEQQVQEVRNMMEAKKNG